VVMDEHGSITQSGSGRQVDFDEVPGVVRPESNENVSISDSDESEDFGDMGIDFELDFGNKLSLENSETSFSASSTRSPTEALDEAIFDLDDF